MNEKPTYYDTHTGISYEFDECPVNPSLISFFGFIVPALILLSPVILALLIWLFW